jgi:hypothetical protein
MQIEGIVLDGWVRDVVKSTVARQSPGGNGDKGEETHQFPLQELVISFD